MDKELSEHLQVIADLAEEKGRINLSYLLKHLSGAIDLKLSDLEDYEEEIYRNITFFRFWVGEAAIMFYSPTDDGDLCHGTVFYMSELLDEQTFDNWKPALEWASLWLAILEFINPVFIQARG